MMKQIGLLTLVEDEDTTVYFQVNENKALSITISESFVENDAFVDLNHSQMQMLHKFLTEQLEKLK